MKKKSLKIFSMLSDFIMSVSKLQVKPACAGTIYQPKVPKCLKESK